jgi:hypothetical protein
VTDHIIATVTLETVVVFDAIVAFDIPLVALDDVIACYVAKRTHLKFNVLQRVHLSNLVYDVSAVSYDEKYSPVIRKYILFSEFGTDDCCCQPVDENENYTNARC